MGQTESSSYTRLSTVSNNPAKSGRPDSTKNFKN
jgi:hypothetical protein